MWTEIKEQVRIKIFRCHTFQFCDETSEEYHLLCMPLGCTLCQPLLKPVENWKLY